MEAAAANMKVVWALNPLNRPSVEVVYKWWWNSNSHCCILLLCSNTMRVATPRIADGHL